MNVNVLFVGFCFAFDNNGTFNISTSTLHLQGHEKRKVVYNLYHILNHYVLFGGGYLSQAKGMIQQILRM